MNLEMILSDSASLTRLGTGAVLGSMLGSLIPRAVRFLTAYKSRKRGKTSPDNVLCDRKSQLAVILMDLLLSAASMLLMPVLPALTAICIIQISLVCVFVDWYMRIIANETVLLMLGLGVVYRILIGGFSALPGSLGAMGLVSVLFGGLATLMTALRGIPEVGAGDIKYAMAAAVVVGWPNVFWFLFCFAGTVLLYCFLGMKLSLLNRKSYFPMCLHLSLGLMGGMFLPLLGA